MRILVTATILLCFTGISTAQTPTINQDKVEIRHIDRIVNTIKSHDGFQVRKRFRKKWNRNKIRRHHFHHDFKSFRVKRVGRKVARKVRRIVRD